MNATAQLSEALQDAFERPTGGVVGLVEDLLRLCPARGFQLDWGADRCRVRFVGDGSEEVLDLPIRKSAFRAILARIAALCAEQNTGSISPYGGRGELVVNADPPAILRVTLTNTTDELKLELVRQ
jgi:hypothetical protein